MACPPKQRFPGLDSLRLLAALLIFLQHTLSSCGWNSWIDLGGFRIGRIGTSIFFALAGYFAATTRRTPIAWFRDRMSFLLPPFWIATGIGFVAAGITGYKHFDSFQVMCQFLGIGYFTHGSNMVNVATWFMTPLLMLYLVATVARLTSAKVVFFSFGAICLLAALTQAETEATVACHCLTFSIAYLVGRERIGLQRRLTIIASGAMAVMLLLHPDFRYGCVTFSLLTLGMEQSVPLLLAEGFSSIAYEWFLVHGLCLTLIAPRIGHPLLVAPIAAITSVLAATGLKRLVQLCQLAVTRLGTKVGWNDRPVFRWTRSIRSVSDLVRPLATARRTQPPAPLVAAKIPDSQAALPANLLIARKSHPRISA